MGVCDGSGRVGTAIGLLITQRSRVQIPPPLLISAAQGPFPPKERAFGVTGHVTKYVTKREPVRRAEGPTGETGWHGVRQRGTR